MEDGLVLAPDLVGEAMLTAMQQKPATEYLVAGPSPRVVVSSDVAAAITAS